MKISGACHCKAIRYEADIDPASAAICHCTDCQMLTGSVYRATVKADAAHFRMIAGEPKIYIKTAESGVKRAHAFCPDCGSPVFATSPENRESYSLRIGALDQRAQLPPLRQQWCDFALPWAFSIEALPKKGRQ